MCSSGSRPRMRALTRRGVTQAVAAACAAGRPRHRLRRIGCATARRQRCWPRVPAGRDRSGAAAPAAVDHRDLRQGRHDALRDRLAPAVAERWRHDRVCADGVGRLPGAAARLGFELVRAGKLLTQFLDLPRRQRHVDGHRRRAGAGLGEPARRCQPGLAGDPAVGWSAASPPTCTPSTRPSRSRRAGCCPATAAAPCPYLYSEPTSRR